MRIRFKCLRVRRYLITNGYVYTVRPYRIDRVERVIIVGIGEGIIIPIMEVRSKYELAQFVYESGFSSVDEWWKTIVSLS